MSWKESTIGDALSVIKNGINCEQNKNPVGNKITRIETIAKKRFDFERVGYANLSEAEKLKSQLKVGDILFSHINSPIHVGKTAIYEGQEDIYHGINLLLMRTKEEIDPYFFNHFLNHLFTTGYWEKNCKKSVNQASVNQKDISKVEFSYPSLSTQQKIVAKLDAVFAEIDKAMAAAETNAKNAEALFQSYLKQVFESEHLNFITKKIGEIAEIFSGSGFPVNQQGFLNKEIPFYKVSDMNLAGNERQMISHNNSISRETAKQLGAKIIPAKSVIFPKIGGAIATNKKRILSVPSCVDNNVMGIYPDDKLVNSEFFFHLLSSIELSSFANEAALPSIKKSTVEERLVKIPKSLSEQERICEIIDLLKENSYKLRDGYFKKLNSLVLLQQSILRKAFAGELVKE